MDGKFEHIDIFSIPTHRDESRMAKVTMRPVQSYAIIDR